MKGVGQNYHKSRLQMLMPKSFRGIKICLILPNMVITLNMGMPVALLSRMQQQSHNNVH